MFRGVLALGFGDLLPESGFFLEFAYPARYFGGHSPNPSPAGRRIGSARDDNFIVSNNDKDTRSLTWLSEGGRPMNALKMKAIMAVVCSLILGVASPACAGPFDIEIKVTAADAAAYDRLGRSVAISGNTAIAGAYLADNTDRDTGSAYLFDATTGEQLHKLIPLDSAPDDIFGASVAISDTIAIVGALRNDEQGYSSGAAYLFDVTTGEQLAKLTASDAGRSDYFGWSVAISGNTAIVGAEGDDDPTGGDFGSAYLFVPEPTTLTLAALGLIGFAVRWRRGRR